MSVYAVICEYNPFHNGHLSQLSEIRRRDADAVILCIMSGYFVQRGEPALLAPAVRAEAAVMGGADAVLLLPMPYSAACAETFCRAGVHIAAKCGADVIAFGAETPDPDGFARVLSRLDDPVYQKALHAAVKGSHDAVGYAAKREEVWRACYGEEDLTYLTEPNNLLGLEYCRAAGAMGPGTLILPRIGSAHDGDVPSVSTASASFLRAAFLRGEPIDAYCPAEASERYRQCLAAGEYAQWERGASYLLGTLSFADPKNLETLADIPVGMGARLVSAAQKSDSVSAFFANCATKKYTDARIRRMTLSALLDVKKTDAAALPAYTELLGASKAGCRHLRKISRTCDFPILIKPAASRTLSGDAKTQYAYTARAARLWRLFAEQTPAPVQKPFLML